MYLDAIQALVALLDFLNEAAKFQTGAIRRCSLARRPDRIDISSSLPDIFDTLIIGRLQTLGRPAGQMAHPIVETEPY